MGSASLTMLERAFALAQTGSVTSLIELQATLKIEGFSQRDLYQLRGRGLQRQINTFIRNARRIVQPPNPPCSKAHAATWKKLDSASKDSSVGLKLALSPDSQKLLCTSPSATTSLLAQT
jgi:hypothetical protein